LSILDCIQPDVERVAEAMAAVIDLEIIIYDEDLKVVAATGGTGHNPKGRPVRGHIVRETMRAMKPVINEIPGHHPLCRPCELWGNCPEKASLNCPIAYEDKAVGTISITAFTDTQRDALLRKKSSHADFLSKMAELISGKIAVQRLLDSSHFLMNQVRAIINSVHEGIIAVDAQGTVVEFSRSAERILGIRAGEVVGAGLGKIMPDSNILRVIESRKGYSEREILCEVRGKRLRILTTAEPLFLSGSALGAVITFKDISEVRNLVHRMTSPQRRVRFSDLVGVSNALQDAISLARKFARSDSTVLLKGESGTGKDLFARAIHSESEFRDGPFMAVNCAAIPESLMESELFGYEEGAFTGARRRGKPGKFELANSGTIFLDEISDLRLHLQAKLLRVLEEKAVTRIGATESTHIDLRILAATNQDLEEMVRGGEFREDLYYRIAVVPIQIPPLRERGGDLEFLVNHLLQKYNSVFGKDVTGLSEEVWRIFRQHSWPGNVRELENTIEYAVNVEPGSKVSRASLPSRLIQEESKARLPGQGPVTLRQMEARMIVAALDTYGNDLAGKRKAAEALGIDLSTLYRKLKRLEG
jgi:PAS domain S-box-containing protein